MRDSNTLKISLNPEESRHGLVKMTYSGDNCWCPWGAHKQTKNINDLLRILGINGYFSIENIKYKNPCFFFEMITFWAVYFGAQQKSDNIFLTLLLAIQFFGPSCVWKSFLMPWLKWEVHESGFRRLGDEKLERRERNALFPDPVVEESEGSCPRAQGGENSNGGGGSAQWAVQSAVQWKSPRNPPNVSPLAQTWITRQVDKHKYKIHW